MNKDLYNQKRAILNDPVGFVAAKRSYNDSHEINLLDNLYAQLKQQKNEQLEIDKQKNLISREIGRAKSDNQPVAKLIQVMQERSAQSKKLEGRICEIEK